jgi:hypothetical protein
MPLIIIVTVLVFAGGCEQAPPPVPMPVQGAAGRALALAWQAQPLAPFRQDQYLLELPPVENTLQQFTFELSLENTGHAPVAIVDISASCGCIETHLSGDTLAPGDTVLLSATVGVAREPDQVDHSLMVTTDEPDGGYFIKLLASIEKPLAGVPTSITFAADAPAREEMLLLDQSDAFAEARTHGAGLNVTVEAVDQGKHRLTVTWDGGGAPAETPELVIETRDRRRYVVPVKIVESAAVPG